MANCLTTSTNIFDTNPLFSHRNNATACHSAPLGFVGIRIQQLVSIARCQPAVAHAKSSMDEAQDDGKLG